MKFQNSVNTHENLSISHFARNAHSLPQRFRFQAKVMIEVKVFVLSTFNLHLISSYLLWGMMGYCHDEIVTYIHIYSFQSFFPVESFETKISAHKYEPK